MGRLSTAVGAMVAILLCGSCAGKHGLQPAGERITLSEDLYLESIGAGIWRHVSFADIPGFGRSPANGLLVAGDGELALIDTPWTSELTGELLDWVHARWDRKTTTVIVTHSHSDCLGGLPAAHRRGAMSYGLKMTAEFAATAGVVAPHQTFEDALDLTVGGRRLELRYWGGGHTADNIVVWVPDAKVLFGGCAVRSATARSLGYTKEADLEAWPRTIQTIRTTYTEAALVVPGHGRPGGVELLEHTLDLLATMPR